MAVAIVPKPDAILPVLKAPVPVMFAKVPALKSAFTIRLEVSKPATELWTMPAVLNAATVKVLVPVSVVLPFNETLPVLVLKVPADALASKLPLAWV